MIEYEETPTEENGGLVTYLYYSMCKSEIRSIYNVLGIVPSN